MIGVALLAALRLADERSLEEALASGTPERNAKAGNTDTKA